MAGGQKEARRLTPAPRPADWWRHAHDPSAIARRVAALAMRHGLRRKTLVRLGQDRVEVLHSPASAAGRPRVYLSAGVHGDEPAAVEGLLRWLEGKPRLGRFDVTIVPCINPGGLRLNTRTDPQGRDLNRAFNRRPAPVIAALKRLMAARGPFALGLFLHEDYDGCGVYLYEIARPGARWGPALLAAAAPFCPPDPRRDIDGRPARDGVVQVDIDSPRLKAMFRRIGMAEAPYLYFAGTPRACTIETPSEFDLAVRAEAHRAALTAALDLLAEEAQKSPT